MVPHPLFEIARAVVLAVLLGISVASTAQSTDSDTSTGTGTGTSSDSDSDSKPSDTWSSDLKAPLRPADDVGGSWNWMLLYGRMTDASLVDDVALNFRWDHSKLYSAEIGYTLKDDNPFVKFMDPVLSSVDVAMNVTYQDDPAGPIFEFNPYIMARWSKFPWSNTIRTTFGLGGGLSYATEVPSIEIDPNDPNGNYSNLLHYMALEATFALPKYKDWQLVYRLHHRSGVFGLMQAENAGNTAIQIGIRHYFK